MKRTLSPPRPPRIPLCNPHIGGNASRYVQDCINSGWVSSVGSFVDRFETAVAEYVGTARGIATVNGTAALHIALLVAGILPDDEVAVSTLTFIAPVNAIRYARAWPVLIDAETRHWQMDVDALANFLGKGCRRRGKNLVNRLTGRRIGAILPVHILGGAVDLAPVIALGRRYGLPVIEDATEGLGGEYRGRKLGGIGDVGCFSFNGNKLITCGGGGMIVTDRADWADRAKYLTTQAKDDPIEYVHSAIGYNYRLTNLLAALGLSQLEQIRGFVAAKRRIAQRYDRRLARMDGITILRNPKEVRSTYWMYTMLVEPADAGLDSRALLRRLEAAQIQTRPLWQPIHRSPAHCGSQFVGAGVADRLYANAISLPCSVNLAETDQQRVLDAIVEALGGPPPPQP